jgi:hypothetical protein
LKLNGTHQLQVYADDVNMLGGMVRIVKKKTEASVVASKKVGREVNADKTTYVFVSGDQNAERFHSINVDNNSIERVVEFKYLRKNLTNPNDIQEAINSRLKSGNNCYHSLRNLLSFSLLQKKN